MGVKDFESKTQAKAAMHDLQALGDKLAALPLTTLASFDLPERLYDAFEVLTRTRGHEGTRRQKQFIGKLMRHVDPEPIAQRLAFLSQSTNEAKATFKRCETWRDKLLEEPASVDAFCAAFPNAKRDVLVRLISQAQTEKAQNKPPKHMRLLFRAVTAIITEPMSAKDE
jgi:ribosome-associated protein